MDFLRRLHPLTLALAVTGAGPAVAHYGMIIPSDTMVMQQDPRVLTLRLGFAHPFEQRGMELVTPKAFRVYGPKGEVDLLPTLQAADHLGAPGFSANYDVAVPGLHVFYMEPQPYWEPAEDVFIIHHTKTYVAAFGAEEGWSDAQGLPTEILPLSKPYGLYAGNVFQGQVLAGGQPVPHAEVEVEFFNEQGTATAPTDYMVTQTILADANGVFTYATPADGWWGFAALTKADYQLPQEGVMKGVELGAVIWVHFEAWQ